MKTVRDACQLQPNALAIKLSDQIEQLEHAPEIVAAEVDHQVLGEKARRDHAAHEQPARGHVRDRHP